jgi:hypothetical protein
MEMLALPRITAVQNGAGTTNHPERAGKPRNASNNPFVKLLAGIGTKSLKKELRTEIRTGSQKTGPAGKLAAPEDGQAKAVRSRGPREAGLLRLTPGNDGMAGEGGKLAPVILPAKEEAPSKAAKSAGPKGSTEFAESPDVLAGGLQGGIRGPGGMEAKAPKVSSDKKTADADTLDANSSGDGTAHAARKGNPTVSVVDLRLRNERRNASRGKPAGEASSPAGKDNLTAASQAHDTSGANALDLRPADVRYAELTGMDRPDPAAKAPPSLSESLAARLREGASDIVRSAQVVLRDGDAGLIRLRLEPESLGNVKIELKMTEKQISGKIVVESDIAGEAFKASMDSLRDAFAESGFETTSLELEVRNGMSFGKGAEGGAEEGKPGDGDPYFSRSLQSLMAAVPALGSGGRDGLLDMIV